MRGVPREGGDGCGRKREPSSLQQPDALPDRGLDWAKATLNLAEFQGMIAGMKYQVILVKSDEGFAVSCPALPGCWS